MARVTPFFIQQQTTTDKEIKKIKMSLLAKAILVFIAGLIVQAHVGLLNAFTSPNSATKWEVGVYNFYNNPDNFIGFALHWALVIMIMYGCIKYQPSEDSKYGGLIAQFIIMIACGLGISFLMPSILEWIGLSNAVVLDKPQQKPDDIGYMLHVPTNLYAWWGGKAKVANFMISILISIISINCRPYFLGQESINPWKKSESVSEEDDRDLPQLAAKESTGSGKMYTH